MRQSRLEPTLGAWNDCSLRWLCSAVSSEAREGSGQRRNDQGCACDLVGEPLDRPVRKLLQLARES